MGSYLKPPAKIDFKPFNDFWFEGIFVLSKAILTLVLLKISWTSNKLLLASVSSIILEALSIKYYILILLLPLKVKDWEVIESK